MSEAESMADASRTDQIRAAAEGVGSSMDGHGTFVALAVAVLVLIVANALPLLVFEIPVEFFVAAAFVALVIGAFAGDSIVD